MIFEILFFILLILVVYTFYRITSKWISGTKRLEGPNSIVSLRIYSNLDLIRFTDKDKSEDYLFERKNLKRGEILEFSYPASKNEITVFAYKKGKEKKFQIPLSS
ncbi:MAG: hypothetical protein WC501_01160 [Candidatus Micrarchaeia archaeon]|jgi:hypothetical protein